MPPPTDVTSNLGQNMPLDSMYSSMFGNISLVILPSQTGEVNDTFGTIPYFSLEYAVFMQQIQASTNSANTTSSQSTGQQNIQGQYTVTDAAGNVRVQMGSGSF